MSILYIRHPSKATVDGALPGSPAVCAFALASDGGAIEREGASTLSELAGAIRDAKRVVLILAASDVNLLRAKVPPMSPARLRLALPNLVEDQLISDPSECVVVAANATTAGPDGLRSVAVVQRVWLEQLQKTLHELGANDIAAIPAQLCLPYQEDAVAAVVIEQDFDTELTLRLSEQDGIGLPVSTEHAESAARDVIQVLRTVVPASPISLYVPQERVGAYQEAVDGLITVSADNWPRKIAAARVSSLNLMTGLDDGGGSRIDWQRWRWPLVLATLVALINIVGLNIEWWNLKKEESSLRGAMIQTFKSAYPKETVIVDAAAQMRRNIAEAKKGTGQGAPDDFLVLAAKFADASGHILQNGKGAPVIVGLEYRDRSLIVRFKGDTDMPTSDMKAALATHNLSLSQPTASAWQIRSEKK